MIKNDFIPHLDLEFRVQEPNLVVIMKKSIILVLVLVSLLVLSPSSVDAWGEYFKNSLLSLRFAWSAEERSSLLTSRTAGLAHSPQNLLRTYAWKITKISTLPFETENYCLLASKKIRQKHFGLINIITSEYY